jgi:hypothetical protein
MRFRVVVALCAVAATGCVSACDGDIFGDDVTSLMAYTCTKPALRDARQLAETLDGMGLRATLIPACDSGWAYVGFKPTVSVGATATELTTVFDCEEPADRASPRSITLRCKRDQSRFVAVLSWDERRSASGTPHFRRDAEATLVRGEADEDVVLGPPG